MEKEVITSQKKQSGTGQWLGFIVAIFGLGGSFYLVATGHDIAGGAIAGIDLIGLVSVFVIGKRVQQKDLDSKKEKS